MQCNSFLSDPGIPGVRSMGPSVCLSVCLSLTRGFADLTDVTLADEDTNSEWEKVIQWKKFVLREKSCLWKKLSYEKNFYSEKSYPVRKS